VIERDALLRVDERQHRDSRAAVASLLRERLAPARIDGSGPVPDDSSEVGGLPVYLTSFVGREDEVAALRERLRRSRLVVLVGPGGAGKTRLAVEVASSARDAYPDGTWFVDLAPLASEQQMAAAVTGVLGPLDTAGRSPVDTIVCHLRGRRSLLVLDNCEHLVVAAAALADALVRGCPEVRVLATSRERLGVAGEAAWRVSTLPIPAAGPHVGADELLRYAAAGLFVDRASQVEPSFALTAANAPAVAEVCRQLDGLPLAIELAAARVRVLTVEQIAERLRDRFRLLTGGSRTTSSSASGRHQTLRALVDWSHDLLSDDERALLRRLVVFSGGWSLDAAECVCADPALAGSSLNPHGVLDLLTGLVDKSLVVAEARGSEERYRFLETIREYAEEKLDQSLEADDLRRRHADWCLALAERAAPHIQVFALGRRAGRRGWMDRLELELDNLRAALAWAERTADSALGLRLAGALHGFWFAGRTLEGCAWVDTFLALDGGAIPPPLHARSLCYRSEMSQPTTADRALGDRCAEEALAIYREIGDPDELAYALETRAAARARVDASIDVVALSDEAVALARRIGDRVRLVAALLRLGSGLYMAGDLERAETVALEADRIACEDGSSGPPAMLASRVLGHIALSRGDPARAARCFEEELTRTRAFDDRYTSVIPETNLGAAYLALGDRARAASWFAEALAVLRDRPSDANLVRCLHGLARLCRRPEQAARLLGVAAAHWPQFWGGPTNHPAPNDEALVEALRTALEPDAFAAAWAEGRATTVEEAIACALDVAAEFAASAPVDDVVEAQPDR
jgi:predicted ATPase